MCGLAGVISTTLSDPEKQRFEELGTLAQLRGTDSTGIIVVSRKNGDKLNIRHRKDVLTSGEFLQTPEIRGIMAEKNVSMMALHARQATIGHVNKANAHPFAEGKYVGMHNGTIPRFAPDKKHAHNDSDSRHLFRLMNSKGIKGALTEADSGAWALVFVDTHARKLHIIRNSQRPLFYMWQTTGSTMYWASEIRMLEFMKEGSSMGFHDPKPFDMQNLYTFDLTGSPSSWTKEYVSTYAYSSSVPAVVPHSSSAYPPWDDYYQNYETYPQEEKKEEKKPVLTAEQVLAAMGTPRRLKQGETLSELYCKTCKYNLKLCECSAGNVIFKPPAYLISDDGTYYVESKFEKLDKKDHKVIKDPLGIAGQDLFMGYKNKLMTRDEYEAVLNNGCSRCCAVPDAKTGKVFFYDADAYFCNDDPDKCYEQQDTKELLYGMSTWTGKYLPANKEVSNAKH